MRIALWKWLSAEGHDACRFHETVDGWVIDGTAVFDHAGNPAALTYRLVCDERWFSRMASISGWVGKTGIDLLIERASGGGWSVNGKIDDALAGPEDIDLGFTPASNTNALRRLGLGGHDEVETVAVWLDTEDWTVKPLRQSYRRVGAHAYAYRSPMHNYEATLTVDDFGVVREYPNLWTMLNGR